MTFPKPTPNVEYQVLFFVWTLLSKLSDVGDPASRKTTAGIALKVIVSYNPSHHDKIAFCAFLMTLCFPRSSADTSEAESNGYYAFEEASSPSLRPPKIRKPPYVKSNIPCVTGDGVGMRISPKFTLCGDLNKGYIPLNPMGQDFDGEPYPFDMMKAKTLEFLARALPYLKNDSNVPKVARVGSSPLYQDISFSNSYQHMGPVYHRIRREISDDNTTNSTDIEDTEEYDFGNESTPRQACDQGGASGLICTLSSIMANNKIPASLVTSVVQGLASMSTASTSGSHANEDTDGSGSSLPMALLKLVGTLANFGSSENNDIKGSESYNGDEDDGDKSEPSSLAHVLSVITGATPNSPNALSLFLKMLTSESSPLKVLASGFPSRRRRPVADEAPAADTNPRRPQEKDYELPPTPCPSSEEYVTPAFARNYQGVWKYVVQIPQEGYFTQTVQQTKCMKNRCDFMDGICHESPRWVSLLVAETYYPDTFFPTSTPKVATAAPPPVEDFYNFQQYLKRRVGEVEDYSPSYRSRQLTTKTQKQQQHCDGYDHIGCFVVRLYYDWFLVNGSCKCWKPSQKRILGGR